MWVVLFKASMMGLPMFGLLARLYPFTNLIKKTWIGEKYLVAKPEDKSGIGMLMKFRDKLITQRMEEIKLGRVGKKVDLLQTQVAHLVHHLLNCKGGLEP